MDFQSAIIEAFAEAYLCHTTSTPLTEAAEAQGILLNQASISGSLPPAPSAGSSVATLQELTSAVPSDRRVSGGDLAVSSPGDGDPGDQPSSGSARVIRSPCGGAAGGPTSCSSSSSVGTNHGGDFRNSSAKQIPVSSKSIPVHCLVEQACSQATEPTVELDSYAIIPSCTLFSDLVRTALIRLGYSSSEVIGARGAIQIKNWRPLTFEQITENSEATVGDILGELTTVAMLRIRLYRNPPEDKEWTDVGVRCAVLELLREMSQSKLAKLCPISQPLISNIVNNRHGGKIGKEKCVEFGAWYAKYRADNPGPPGASNSEKPQDGRLTFHPVHELPKLREWFRQSRNPTLKNLEMYVEEINNGHVRQQDRPKVAMASLKNWWKNERQRFKKQSTKINVNESSSQDLINSPDTEMNVDNKRPRLVEEIIDVEEIDDENIDCPKRYLNL